LTWPLIEAHRGRIAGWLDDEVSVATIAQRLRFDHAMEASESSVHRWISANLAQESVRERVTVARGPVAPGSEAQIDYGRLGMWWNPATGRRVAVEAFVMVLPCSRHMFVRPVIKTDQTAWCAAHVAAFEFFGGVPARLVPDNLKTCVDKPDLYDPKINKAYAELAAHYATLVDPARARKPKDKPRVERQMPYIRDSFWAGREFDSVEQMQDDAIRWCLEVAGTRHSRALDGEAPVAVFAAIEQSELIPLPRTPFQLAVWSTGKVGTDCHLKIAKALYSVPWRLIGQQVHARTCGDLMQIVHEGTVVATHVLRLSGRGTGFDHYPPEKIAFHMRNPTWCRRVAAEVGPSCAEVIAGFMEVNAIHRLRSAQGVLALTDRGHPVAANAALHVYVVLMSGNTVLADLIASVDRRVRWCSLPIARTRREGLLGRARRTHQCSRPPERSACRRPDAPARRAHQEESRTTSGDGRGGGLMG
jgi:transposase